MIQYRSEVTMKTWLTVVAALFALALCRCATWPDEDNFDRLVTTVTRLRDSKDPADREHYAIMQMTAKERKIAKQFSDLRPDDPIGILVCRNDLTMDPNADDTPEPSEPEVPEQLSNFPTRYTVEDLIDCMANSGLMNHAYRGFWLMKQCVLDGLQRTAELHEEYLRSHGFANARCYVTFTAGFKNPSDRTWAEKTSVTPEEIVTMLLGLQKPIPGIPMKWFTTNMVEPFPGCGLCKNAPIGGDR
jgi:hypothetical protein